MYSRGSITAPVSYEDEGMNLEWSPLSDFEVECKVYVLQMGLEVSRTTFSSNHVTVSRANSAEGASLNSFIL